MHYEGIIIEESLENLEVLHMVSVVETRIEAVTKQHQTPWLTQWTLHKVIIPAEDITEVTEQLSASLSGHNWYSDFRNDRAHYVVFPRKVFRIDREKPDQYRAAIAYGLELGIPEQQLDFMLNESQ